MDRDDAIGMLRLMGYDVVPMPTHVDGKTRNIYHATFENKYLGVCDLDKDILWERLAYKYLGGTYTDHLTE